MNASLYNALLTSRSQNASAVFRRRNPLPLWQRLRGLIWPDIGWRRLGSYLVKRVTRMPGTPHSLAAGFACGAAISFTPFVGFHLIGAALLCFFARGNYLASAVGTVVGNPATFPFIWVASYRLGHWLLGSFAIMPRSSEAWTLQWLLENYERLVWPMTVGGVPLGIAVGLALYFPLVKAITAYQEVRRRRRERRARQRAGRPLEPAGAPTDAAGI